MLTVQLNHYLQTQYYVPMKTATTANYSFRINGVSIVVSAAIKCRCLAGRQGWLAKGTTTGHESYCPVERKAIMNYERQRLNLQRQFIEHRSESVR